MRNSNFKEITILGFFLLSFFVFSQIIFAKNDSVFYQNTKLSEDSKKEYQNCLNLENKKLINEFKEKRLKINQEFRVNFKKATSNEERKKVRQSYVYQLKQINNWYYKTLNENKIKCQEAIAKINKKQNVESLKYYSIDEVLKNNSKESCWSIIRGKVYDLTSWIDKHPGGSDKILNICGKDGTEVFYQFHKGEERPENTLKNFKIGELKN